ncbi:MAG: isoprenyl transferase [Candidatus Aureabacteria bacterium]|nr:isoprenyl transferase [Candidatus Auribacterota bacterium]
MSSKSPRDPLLSQIDQSKLPVHIAIIMDGNGRWAKKRHFGRIRGHREGVQAIRNVIKLCVKLAIPYLTLFAFSSENWNRPSEEVNALWNLLSEFLKKEMALLKKNHIRLNAIGRLQHIPDHAKQKIDWAMKETCSHTGLFFTLALNYGARDEIVDAVNQLLQISGSQPISVTEKMIRDHLYTRNMPDPDLLIRTSGEKRLSNFLLWQLSYSELVFTETLWPDFKDTDLAHAIIEYQKRHRRYGRV